ncbi:MULTISPECIES: dihydroneopterin aldolase [unclassified Nitratiruptor]|uniref:dihydroneopterin aldolase n=1 Tax=unclassified Nitratiruptor TaxID=2624044 RepID=UPI001914F21E|nr:MULTISPECIES: dihydroneopterin aldolase [unclassified Nitratiruptor]BCD59750.1 7,8-dihydroneopterin aldolase/epimerase/oxygenase [Nitratiruptor sp. YY08-10]BCD63674.1 7,8-dihydroneopterin aldolase/epimerase/oxygenase [Nitratiruptor sp. YY08-14]
MEYTIRLEQLYFDAIIGILPQERSNPQPLEIFLEVVYEKKEDFVDYALLETLILHHFQERRFQLLEEALEETLFLIKKRFPSVKKATMRIKKPTILSHCVPSVSLSLNFS